MRIQCISRPIGDFWSLPTTGMLFSDWQAAMHALQPTQAFKSIAMPQALPAVLVLREERFRVVEVSVYSQLPWDLPAFLESEFSRFIASGTGFRHTYPRSPPPTPGASSP